ncbi:HemD-like protein [Glarea lozoyensis ATCC 20868]|uniref:HemD-like protein n=1 Tax=Glarea lozoyensis (strain ATCC 20868 / MF5171) TaxID=1116229 RepID=S3DB88_GLAL2|nr:HemD-like protein [Glarea lozoyensis ATCC 20868]EPE34364.1 HemD-like protein [Glarea lozoyensis ATCC 20868]
MTTPILLLKTKSKPHDGYAELFAQSGKYEPIFVPVLEHKFLDAGLNVVRGLLREGGIGRGEDARYGGMIFTSQRAVEAFTGVVGEIGLVGEILGDVPIYTVGPATSRALRSIPNTKLNIFGEEAGNGEVLAGYILDHYAQWYQHRTVKPPLLFLVGETRRDIIPKTLMNPSLPPERRIQVDELEVYGTGVMESFEDDFREVLARTGEGRWVVVFSPTGCEVLLRLLKEKREEGTRIITIGPTTRDFLRDEFGFEPDVCAGRPSPEGLMEGIEGFEGGEGRGR